MYSINRNTAVSPILTSGIRYNGTSTKYLGYKNASMPRVDKILAVRPNDHDNYNTIYFSEVGTGQIWKYGYNTNIYGVASTSTLFKLLLPHQNLTNNIASRTTGLNIDSTTYIPLFKVSNCAQTYFEN